SLLMPVVRGADDDGVDVLARQNFRVVAGGEGVLAPDLLAVLKAAVVAVGYGDELDAGHLHGGFGVELALAASSDKRDLNVVVGGDRFLRLGFLGLEHEGLPIANPGL